MGSCSRVKGCYGDSAAKRGMVRLLERKIKVRECEKKGQEKEEEESGGGGWTQDSINCDGGQKKSWCDLLLASSPVPSHLGRI